MRPTTALLYTLSTLALSATATASGNLGLAVSGLETGAGLIVMNVSEAGQGSDLNGDGDRSDSVLHVRDLRRDRTTNLGIAALNGYVASDRLVVFIARESNQGGTDLNGDGDAVDQVAHVFDAFTGSVTNLERAATGDVAIDGDRVAFRVPEFRQGEDLNGDGDQGDEVLHVYDAGTGALTNLELDAPRDDFALDGPRVALLVRESRQGAIDLNADGDSRDEVVHAVDLTTGAVTNAALAAARLQAHGGFVTFVARESSQGTDLNTDGDRSDLVLHRLDADGDVVNLGLAASTGFQARDHRVLFSVSERSQGLSDLNGDGDTNDFVVHVADALTAVIANLGVDAFPLFTVRDSVAAFAVREAAQGGTDLNGDGDAFDNVLHALDLETGTVSSAGLATSFRDFAVDGHVVAFPVFESADGPTDHNGDGDTVDQVLHTLDVRTGTIANLGLAIRTAREVEAGSGVIAFPVSESNEGDVDLNGDGDTLDFVLHAHVPAAGVTENLALAARFDSVRSIGPVIALQVPERDQGGLDRNDDLDTFDDVAHIARVSPIADLTLALDDVAATLAAHQGSEVADKLEDVLDKGEAALDELSESPPDLQAVAGTLEGAAGDLESAFEDGLLDVGTALDLLEGLVRFARRLAAEAVAAAVAQGADANELEDALEALAEGDTLREAGDYKDAAASYKDALADAEGAVD